MRKELRRNNDSLGHGPSRIRLFSLVLTLGAAALTGCSLGSADVREFDRPGSLAAYQQGNRALAAEDLNAAVDGYTRAIALDPSWPEPYNNRGLTYIRLRLYQDAVEDLQRALAAGERDPEVLYNLGTAHLQRGFFDHASAWFLYPP